MANELRVRQNWIGGQIEDNPLSAAATTLTSAALAAVSAIGATQHMSIVLDPDGLYGEPEIAWITAHTAGATTATIARGQEGSTARSHYRDVPWSHGPTKKDFGAVKYASRSSGDISFNSTSWADVDTALDLTFEAQAGDVVEYAVNGLWGDQAVSGYLDAVTVVSAAPVNSLVSKGAAPSTNGLPGWHAPGGSYGYLSGSTMYALQAGDISSGLVTIRLRAKLDSTTTKWLLAQAGWPLEVWAKNHGPRGY